jgi:hypothetical protein
MIVIIDVLQKIIRVGMEEFFIPTQDFSWIPSNITNVRWHGTNGQIQYAPNEDGSVAVEFISELGIYEKAIEMFNNEKQRIADEQKAQEEAIEAARDYWAELRYLRDQKLLTCDWTQGNDSPLSEEQKTAWKVYRQELRDLPESISDPKPLVKNLDDSNWPIPPNK